MASKIITLVPPFDKDKIIQGFGFTPWIQEELAKGKKHYADNLHHGIDYSWKGCAGEPIRAAHDGIVVVDRDMDKGGYGIHVTVWDDVQDIATRYGHMVRNIVVINQRVKQGDVLGYIGNTGNSTGPHLHWEAIFTNNGYPIQALPMGGAFYPLIRCA